jgi:hypothetical protein
MKRHLFLICAALILAACLSVSGEPTPITVEVREHTNPNAFDVQYPADWEGLVVAEGVMVFGPPEVAGLLKSGPSVTIFRISAEGVTGSDEEFLDTYLSRGPLRDGFETNGSVGTSRIGRYQGLGVELKRDQSENVDAFRGLVMLVRTDSGAVYVFSATSPTESWEEHWPPMKVIIDSVRFHE